MPDLYDEMFTERDKWETEPDWWEISNYRIGTPDYFGKE